MALARFHRLRCDKCGTWLTVTSFKTAQAARLAAKQNGAIRKRRDDHKLVDYCSRCARSSE